jgi:curli biogenesis system outer membrane secretion channel CsgG
MEDKGMTLTHAISICSTAIVTLGLVGCVTTMPIQMTVPAETDISNVRRLAVMPFDGRGGAEVRSAVETALLNAQVNGIPYFTMVTRDQLDRVVAEQNKGHSVRFDNQTAPSVGRLLGADALVTGSVTEYDTTDNRYSQQWERTTYSGDGKKSKKTINAPCLKREARIALTAKFINARTGQVIASKPLVASTTAEDCAETNSQIDVADKNVMLMGVANKVAMDLVNKITPHRVTKRVELRSADDGGGRVTEQVKRGYQYATNGRWDLAISEWEQAAQVNPNSAAAHYNLGVAYEAQGQLERARTSYDKAAQLKADTLYIRSSADIEQRIREADEVQRQMSGREQ